jgi:hypothetical protein
MELSEPGTFGQRSQASILQADIFAVIFKFFASPQTKSLYHGIFFMQPGGDFPNFNISAVAQ